MIKAYSPQAKGRVERSHGVYQDRLVKEIRLQKLGTIKEVNQLLQKGFIEGLNRRFKKDPVNSTDGHVPLLDVRLDKVFIWKYKRQVQNDWVIQFQGKIYQLVEAKGIVQAKQKITVCIDLNGCLKMYSQGQELNYREIAEKPKQRPHIKKEYSVSDRVKAALKGKNRSPWKRFNPNWLSNKSRQRDNHCNQST